MRKIFACLVTVLLINSHIILAQETSFMLKEEGVALSLDESIAIALRDNKNILLKEEQVKKAKLKISEAQSSFYPTLNFTGEWRDTRGLYSKDIGATSTQISVKQYLYKGNKTVNTLKYNGFQFEEAVALLDKEKMDLILNVKKAFYTLLLAKEFFDINKAIVENMLAHLDLAKARFKAGLSSESEILALEASLNTASVTHEISLNQVDSAGFALKTLLYLDKDTKISPKGEFAFNSKEVELDKAFLTAIQIRPEIKQYEAQVKASEKSIEIAKTDNRPSIYALWDYYGKSVSSLSSLPSKGWQDYNVVGVILSWPIFDGWLTKAKVEQAVSDLRVSRLSKEKVVKDVVLEVKKAYLDLKNALSKLKSQESELSVYKDNAAVVKHRYESGVSSLLDFSDANLKYQIAVFNNKQAIYDYLMAKSEFDRATGG